MKENDIKDIVNWICINSQKAQRDYKYWDLDDNDEDEEKERKYKSFEILSYQFLK